MKKLKSGLSVMFAVLITATVSCAATTDAAEIQNPVWPQYRGDSRMLGVTDAKTPVSADKTEEKWKIDLNDGWADPSIVILGDSLYTVYGSMMSGSCYLQKRSLTDGSLQQQTGLIENTGFFPYITYGDGKLFVSVDDGRIEAFDANTLSPLWVSETPYDPLGDDGDGLQSLAPIIYNNGYVYTGATYGNATTGMYYCVSADGNETAPSDSDEWKDDITSAGLKVNKFQWTYVPDTGKKGFYWSGGAVAGNAIIFGGDNGELVSHSLTGNTVYDKIDLNISGYSKDGNSSAVRSAVYYDKTTGRAFVSSKEDCTINSIAVKPDGSFDHSSLIQKQINNAGNITSSPIVYNGRLYIGSGGMGAGPFFSVLDAKTLNIIYQVPVQTQSTPVISTAYANSANHNTVYIYVAKYPQTYEDGKLKDSIYCIKDYEGNTSPDYRTLITPSVPQSNTCSLAADGNGTLYYKNDSGTLFAFANKDGGAYTAQDVINAINRIPGKENLTTDDEILVERARSRYDGLSASKKQLVTNYSLLDSAEKRISYLNDIPNIVSKLISDIGSLPDTVTLDRQQTVYSLLNTYDSLPDGYKASVTNAQKLLTAKAQIDKINDDKSVSDVCAAIDALPSDVHYDSRDAINAAYQKYSALSDTLKARVTNADVLKQKKSEADSIINAVTSLNSDIWNKINPSKISYADKGTVNELIARYNALASYDRQFVQYYNDVLDAQKAISGTKVTVCGTPSGSGYMASIKKSDVDATTVTAVLGNISASFSDSLLDTLTENGPVQIESYPLDNAILSKIGSDIGKNSRVFDSFSLNLIGPDGKNVHNLGEDVTVTVKLTGTTLCAINGSSDAKLYYYNPSSGRLEDMNAVFDIKNKTVTFKACHFSDFIIAGGNINASGPSGAENGISGKTGDTYKAVAVNPETGNLAHGPAAAVTAAFCIALTAILAGAGKRYNAARAKMRKDI